MKRAKANSELRELASAHSVCLFEIAQEMGVADSTVYRWFRTEMSQELHDEVKNAIYQVGSTAPEDRL